MGLLSSWSGELAIANVTMVAPLVVKHSKNDLQIIGNPAQAWRNLLDGRRIIQT
jgi:hypothetical protein